jgi:hypothetical protein
VLRRAAIVRSDERLGHFRRTVHGAASDVRANVIRSSKARRPCTC